MTSGDHGDNTRARSRQMNQHENQKSDYTVGWICALSLEQVAAQVFFDELHERPEGQSPNDSNCYTLGKIGKHNVVIATLPHKDYGISSATSVIKDILHSFPNIRIGLMVGIGGGAPSQTHDIRLGDVVVSTRVLQYDFGKAIEGQSFQMTGSLAPPPKSLLTAVAGLDTKYMIHGHQLQAAIDSILERNPRLRSKFGRPDPSTDRLYRTGFVHSNDEAGDEARPDDATALVLRRQRAGYENDPAIHYGLIASANMVMKNAIIRDQFAEEREVLCFEMEAAGLMNHFPFLVIRGICDYADTHKSKEWKGFAAMTAAAYAKDLLAMIPLGSVQNEKTISGALQEGLQGVQMTIQEQTAQQLKIHDDDKGEQCLQALLLTDPCQDKERIQQAKGGLLRDSYRWILDNSEYKQFLNEPQSRLLWIRGDPGKGKTMLLIGIINELQNTNAAQLFYFFCQATEPHLRDAASVLRGLIYLLVVNRPALLRHVRARYDSAGEKLFGGPNTWVSLVGIFNDIINDSTLKNAVFMVDALDECSDTTRDELVALIIKTVSSPSSNVKWIISSRNWPEIEGQLASTEKLMVHLEINASSVSDAVDKFILDRVGRLASLKAYSDQTRNDVRDFLKLNADGTFLWVALVCEKLTRVPGWDTLRQLREMPKGLGPLYERMMRNVYASPRCMEVLAIVSVVFRPINLQELHVHMTDPTDIQLSDLEGIIGACGSFLTVREGVVYFVHQSAKDYLIDKQSHKILPEGMAEQHRIIFSKSLEALSGTLQRDMYDLGHPGSLIDQVWPLDPDPLASVGYSSVFWVEHAGGSNFTEMDSWAGKMIYRFISKKYLYWLESLCLLEKVSEGVIAVHKLVEITNRGREKNLSSLIQDAWRFLLAWNDMIRVTPLQIYASALVFSPSSSIIRALFRKEEPDWITLQPVVAPEWNACLQTLEGSEIKTRAFSVRFSPDGSRVAAGYWDCTIRLWDLSTGACEQTLTGHPDLLGNSDFINNRDVIDLIVFSPEGRLIAGSGDGRIRVWDLTTGECVQTFKGPSTLIGSIVFSPDGRLIAASGKGTIRVWEATTGACVRTLEDHSNCMGSLGFSPDGHRTASGSHDCTIKSWDAATGVYLRSFQVPHSSMRPLEFSPDGQLVVGLEDKTIKAWNAASGECLYSISRTYGGLPHETVFSPDGRLIVVKDNSSDSFCRVLNAATGEHLRGFERVDKLVMSIACSPNNKRLATGSHDGIIRIWDMESSPCKQTPHENHNRPVESVTFTPDVKKLASKDSDGRIRIWDTATGMCVKVLEDCMFSKQLPMFSPNSQRLAVSFREEVEIWDMASHTCLQTFDTIFQAPFIRPAIFSPDGQRIASSWLRKTEVEIWDLTAGSCLQTFRGHIGNIRTIVFSPVGQQLASGAYDATIRVWDVGSTRVRILTGHTDSVDMVSFSPDGQRLASDAEDRTIKIWDIERVACLQTFHTNSRTEGSWSFVFLPDGQRLASASYATISVWSIATGTLLQMIEMGPLLSQLSPDARGHSCLCTNLGSLDLDRCYGSGDDFIECTWEGGDSGYSIDDNGAWILKDRRNILWLPPEYRPKTATVAGATIAIGCHFGRVRLMRFAFDDYSSSPMSLDAPNM